MDEDIITGLLIYDLEEFRDTLTGDTFTLLWKCDSQSGEKDKDNKVSESSKVKGE